MESEIVVCGANSSRCENKIEIWAEPFDFSGYDVNAVTDNRYAGQLDAKLFDLARQKICVDVLSLAWKKNKHLTIAKVHTTQLTQNG